MAYRILWTRVFEEDFKKLEEKFKKRVVLKTEFLAQNPQQAERVAFAPLGLDNLSKYRIGDYRLLFWLDRKKEILTLYKINRRDQIYKKL
jgi:mRNA-degrading endonuclease RelE of RelBE toxin-antitoxin system